MITYCRPNEINKRNKGKQVDESHPLLPPMQEEAQKREGISNVLLGKMLNRIYE